LNSEKQENVNAPRQTDFADLLRRFHHHNVNFVIVGGVAAVIHGSARLTFDLDIVYDRDSSNLERLTVALADVSPYLRGVPPGLPFQLSPQTLKAGLNFTLTTTVGDLDLLGEITGGGTYARLLPRTTEAVLFNIPCRCLDLEMLIETKRAAGRPKDIEAIAELEAILEVQNDD
jgi:hypothetical protein